MRIAIGSRSPVQLAAAKEAWNVFAESIQEESSEETEFLSFGVSSDAPEMPYSVSDLMKGAEGRVENLILQLKRERTEADFYIGLQSGFHVLEAQGPRRQALLESWAYVSDGHRGSFGHGGGVPVPSRIADQVIDRGIELGIALDRFSTEIQDNDQGPWGILTKEILSGKHSFVIALIAAFAPFYNSELY